MYSFYKLLFSAYHGPGAGYKMACRSPPVELKSLADCNRKHTSAELYPCKASWKMLWKSSSGTEKRDLPWFGEKIKASLQMRHLPKDLKVSSRQEKELQANREASSGALGQAGSWHAERSGETPAIVA